MPAVLYKYKSSPKALEKRMLSGLFSSLEYIHEEGGDVLRQHSSYYKKLSAAKKLQKVSPVIFVRTLELIEAVEKGELDKAQNYSRDIYDLSKAPEDLGFYNYSEEELGSDYTRIAEILFGVAYGKQPIIAVPECSIQQVTQTYKGALDLVKEYHPVVASEIDAFWSRIYLGQPNQENETRGFGGVTSLMVWGASFSNTQSYKSLIQAADFMVHEATHALLFALSHEDPLVRNPITEVYSSPLRKDPRPMDGIFHATIVCARVSEFYHTLAQEGAKIEEGDDYLLNSSRKNAERYREGVATIKEFGDISQQGIDLLEQADEVISHLQ